MGACRRRSGDHGHRADPGLARGAQEGRLEASTISTWSRPTRRSRRRPARSTRTSAGTPPRSTSTAARSRIGHPIGASGARVLVTLLLRNAEAQRQEGPRHAVHRRRHGHRHVRRAASADTHAKTRTRLVRGLRHEFRSTCIAGTSSAMMTEQNWEETRHGARGVGHGRNARHRRRHLQGAEGGRLQGRRQLRRQRRGGAEVQGRDRHRGLQVGRVVLRGLRRRHQAGRGRARARRRAGQQRRHHARRHAPPDEAGAMDAR